MDKSRVGLDEVNLSTTFTEMKNILKVGYLQILAGFCLFIQLSVDKRRVGPEEIKFHEAYYI